jgi:pentatricopeptide repeat protein
MSYVSQEDAGTVAEHFDFHRDPFLRGYAPSDGPRLQISEAKDDVSYPQRGEIYTGDDELKQRVARLCSAIGIKMRHPHRVTLESIYKEYSQLPEPRMLNLTGQWRSRLLRVMGAPQSRDSESMLRYFALVADVKNAGLTLRRAQWNYALTFATKYASRLGSQELDSALRLWRQMEHDAQIKGNDVTFNVLFDVASKAGNFTLAEMIYKEMDSRGIEFNRFHHVSLIHFFGLKLDSGGVRAAYKEMVESGEMIDTVTLNCVISSFLRCGEEAAAEETYQRMRSGNPRALKLPERNYMMGKVVTKVMMMFSKVGKDHPQLKRSLQTNVRLEPDVRTFRLFVEHYAIRVGDLAKVAQYLDEMKFLHISVHPTIFLALFKGFYTHGGTSGSEWSAQRLGNVLAALYDVRDENARGFRIDRWLVIWALRAVKKCSSTEEVVHTFDQFSHRWDIPMERHAFMQEFLDNLVRGRDMKATRRKSIGTLHRA